MNSPTSPEIYWTKQLFSLYASLFFFLDSSLLPPLQAHEEKSASDTKKVQNASTRLHFKYGRNKEVKTTVAGRRAPLPSDIH